MIAKIGKRTAKAKESKEVPVTSKKVVAIKKDTKAVEKTATKKRETKAEAKVVDKDDSKLKRFGSSGPIDVMLA